MGGHLDLDEAVAAARALRNFTTEAAGKSVASLLERVATPSRLTWLSQLEQELAAILLAIGDEGGIEVARRQLGDAWVDHAVAVRRLKLIPRRFLPRSSTVLMLELK